MHSNEVSIYKDVKQQQLFLSVNLSYVVLIILLLWSIMTLLCDQALFPLLPLHTTLLPFQTKKNQYLRKSFPLFNIQASMVSLSFLMTLCFYFCIFFGAKPGRISYDSGGVSEHIARAAMEIATHRVTRCPNIEPNSDYDWILKLNRLIKRIP